MFKKIANFYSISAPSVEKVPADQVDKKYKKLRFQAFVAGTIGYSLYYVCRTSLNVMKQPIIDSGTLDATQLGIIGACLYWTYAVGKFVNGFLADHCNIKKFMATGLLISQSQTSSWDLSVYGAELQALQAHSCSSCSQSCGLSTDGLSQWDRLLQSSRSRDGIRSESEVRTTDSSAHHTTSVKVFHSFS